MVTTKPPPSGAVFLCADGLRRTGCDEALSIQCHCCECPVWWDPLLGSVRIKFSAPRLLCDRLFCVAHLEPWVGLTLIGLSKTVGVANNDVGGQIKKQRCFHSVSWPHFEWRMSLLEKETPSSEVFRDSALGCVVVGAGPIGSRVAQTLSRAGVQTTVLGDEVFEPYNRVRLTPLLGGEAQLGEITLDDMEADSEALQVRLGHRVVRILREKKQVATADGRLWPYEKLILATGSRAFIPEIPGRALSGVFRFRSADDASALLARSFSARHVAVIGGGLLGLEAARGMARRNCHVTVLEHESHLMPRQLDQDGGALLSALIRDLGVSVRTGVAVRNIEGTTRVTGLTLSSGEEIDADTVVICTGIRPNIDLARSSGLAFGKGIAVNDRMQTSDPDIFAVGECAEFDGQLFGLVGPGYLQAEVATSVILGAHERFEGASPATKLKIIGADVFSVGDIAQLEVRQTVRSHVWQEGDCYRRIFIERGRLVGALAVGAWPQSSRVQDAVNQGATVYPWMLFRFRKAGSFWSDDDMPVDAMPDSAVLCNCTGVTCGQIRGAMRVGCGTIEAVSTETSAGTVCGTCRPLIGELIETGAKPEPMPLWKPVLVLSGLGLALAVLPFVGGSVPLPTSYDPESLRDWLWRDNIVKQWSGFVLLGLILAAFAIGLRKRFRATDRLGSFDAWRLVHNGIGLAALLGFFAHTGFSLGSGWNLALGLTFVGTVLLGSLAGLATGGDHELRARRIGSARKPPRRLPTWAHILLLWPLPVLIAFHVLASYAF